MIQGLYKNVFMTTHLGDYVMRLRTSKGMTQRDLAKKAGFSHGTIQKIEVGATEHPGLDVIVGIAKALNVSEADLLLAYKGIDPDTKRAELEGSGFTVEEMMMKALEKLREGKQ